MKRFKKILLWTVGSLLTLVAVFLICGYFANPEFKGTRSISVNSSPQKIYALMMDIKNFSESRHEVKKAEILPDTQQGYPSWQEYTSLHGVMKYEIVHLVKDKEITIRMVQSDFGMTGTWRFAFVPEGTKTRVTLTEHSDNEGLLMRSILNTIGRDGNMKLLLRAVQKQAESPHLN